MKALRVDRITPRMYVLCMYIVCTVRGGDRNGQKTESMGSVCCGTTTCGISSFKVPPLNQFRVR